MFIHAVFVPIVNAFSILNLLFCIKNVNLSIITDMKMLIVFVMICGLMCGINLLPIKNFDLKGLFGEQDVEVYVDENIVLGYESVANGTGSVIFAKISDLDYILKNYNVQGYTIKIEGMGINSVIDCLGAKVIEISDFGVYGYLAGIFPEITIKENKCNFQAVGLACGTLLGVPILLGGY